MEIQCFSLVGEKKCFLILKWIGERVWRRLGSLGEVWEKFWRRESHFKGENLSDCLDIAGTVIAEVVLDTD